MVTKTEDYTVVEVKMVVGQGTDSELLNRALSVFLEDCGEAGSEDTETFDQVNAFGIIEKENLFLLTFLGPTHNFEEIEKGVRSFLDAFKSELDNEELADDWRMDLDSDTLPSFESYQIETVRKYEW